MGAFGGVYPVVDGALHASAVIRTALAVLWIQLSRGKYEGPGRLFGLPGRYFASAELDDWASDVPEWVRFCFGFCFGFGFGFGFMVVLTHIFYAPAAKQTLPQADRSFHLI